LSFLQATIAVVSMTIIKIEKIFFIDFLF